MKFAGFARSALDELRRLPSLDAAEYPRADLLRKTGFQVRFQLPLPRDAERPAFVPWCAGRLKELIPAHRWLVKHLHPENDAR
jgi:hypothetical protein